MSILQFEMNKTIFLFDIDGTLLLTGGAGKVAFEQVFEKLFGEKYVWQNIKPDGKTDPLIIDELFIQRFGRNPNPNEQKQIIDLYNAAMEHALKEAENFRLMPFVPETLQKLFDTPGVILGLATGNFEISAWHKLRHAKLDQFFKFGGFGSDSGNRLELTKLALDRAIKHIGGQPKEVYVVGDTIHDIQCGQDIGAKTIAVCTGSTKRQTLEQANPTCILDDLSTFPNLF